MPLPAFSGGGRLPGARRLARNGFDTTAARSAPGGKRGLGPGAVVGLALLVEPGLFTVVLPICSFDEVHAVSVNSSIFVGKSLASWSYAVALVLKDGRVVEVSDRETDAFRGMTALAESVAAECALEYLPGREFCRIRADADGGGDVKVEFERLAAPL